MKPLQQKKEVMLLRDDYRFTTLIVDKETDYVNYCKKKDGVTYRIFKLGPGWTEKIVRFLAVDGMPIVHNVKASANQAVFTVEDFLRNVWGDDFERLPDKLKQLITTSSIGVTVEIEPIMPDDNLKRVLDRIKADGMLYDADIDNLAKLGESVEKRTVTQAVMDKLPWIFAGFGLNYILMSLGVLK